MGSGTETSFLDMIVHIGSKILPFGPSSRLHWTGLLAFVVLAFVVYRWGARRKAPKEASFWGFLFPKDVYFSESSRLDFKLYFVNQLFAPVSHAFYLSILVAVATLTANGFSQLLWSDISAPGWLALIGGTLVMALFQDFAIYVKHRLHHEWPVLWPFHKVHHSATVMTPMTLYRKHPVYDFLGKLLDGVFLGFISGVILALFGIIEVKTILGVNLVYLVFNVLGANLRHSHIWLSFGPVLSRVLISPAQHQIHHSSAPEHHDKNYGQIFALWDWMFGTLYVPKGREEITFGVADRDGNLLPQVHNGLVDAYLVPFRESAKVIRRRSLAARKTN